MEIKLLFSRYYQDKGDIPTALKWLSEALEIAAPEGFMRIFLDEAPVLELLPQVRETAPDLVDAILGQQKSAMTQFAYTGRFAYASRKARSTAAA